MNPNPTRFAIYTLGCKVNQYESQAIAEQLQACGMVQAEWNEPCEVVILNTCAVTAESVRKAKQLVRRAIKNHPHAAILVSGCATQLAKDEFSAIAGVDYICGTRNKNTVVEHALALCGEGKRRKNDAVQTCICPPDGDIEKMTITRFDRTRAYVKIQDGCNGKCTYCIIPTLRGKVCSRDARDVIEEVKGLTRGGCREVVLTGIETSAYEYDLAGLMEQISALPGIDRIRLGSLDPSFMKPIFVDRIASLDKVAPHFHLSLQSGSDSVLMRMKRRYLMKTVYENIAYLKAHMPRVRFSTDIIVGFPGETEEEFAQTVRAVKEIGFLHVHIFPFSPRPGTEAATMSGSVPEQVKNERAARLARVAEQTRDEALRAIVAEGRALSVLVETVGKDGTVTGHSEQFAEVHFRASATIGRGEIVRIRPEAILDGHIDGSMLEKQ